MSLAQQVRGWTSGIGVWRKLAIALAAAALASGLATYLALTGAPPFGPGPRAVLILLLLDLVLLLALACWVAKRFVEVWLERRRGLAGSRLQVRLVGLFSLIAVTPTIIVAVFSYLFFSFGVESWFSDKVRTAISESVAVADAYAREHQQAIRADALAMAADLDRSAATLALNPQYLAPVLTAQAAMRGLTEAAVVDRRGQMVARTGLAFALGFEDVSQDALRRANMSASKASAPAFRSPLQSSISSSRCCFSLRRFRSASISPPSSAIRSAGSWARRSASAPAI